ncbi:MAG: PilN domain-containing protein [bacterium]|nr:PilN domain-containing protein [bacterium]
MPAKMITVNLLDKEGFANSASGRIVNWAITYGRYIMIGTEIAVLLAFISRFSLDRKLTDLTEAIGQKRAVLEANLPVEDQIRSLERSLALISERTAHQELPLEILSATRTALPPDVYFESWELTGDILSVDAAAGSETGLSQFLTNLRSNTLLTNIEMGDVNKSPLTGILFSFTAEMKNSGTPVAPEGL